MCLLLIALASSSLLSTASLGAQLATAGGPGSETIMLAGELKSVVMTLRNSQRGVFLYTVMHDRKRADTNRGFYRTLRSVEPKSSPAFAASPPTTPHAPW